MTEYKIVTDSGSDIDEKTLASWGVGIESLTFKFNDSDKEYKNDEMPEPEFYAKMRSGLISKTSAISTEKFKVGFKKVLDEGFDLLYLGFDTGISNTYNSGRLACEQLKEEYPDRKILSVDTLCASAGEGLMVYLAVKQKNAGKSIEEVADYVEKTKLKLCHWFTVDDLVYLKRGGRVSPTAAFVGGLLGIKPVLHVDNEGHLINVSKVRGRKASIIALADEYTKRADDKEHGEIFISHGDCIEDVEELKKILKQRHNVEVTSVSFIGPVIGSHSGPGTLALFFVGSER